MRILLNERKVQLSVTEFAEFRTGPSYRGAWGMGRRRSEIGQKWHRELQGKAEEEFPQSAFEVSVKADWRYRNWILSMHGRIDQVVGRNGLSILREVKTVGSELPQSEGALRELYPSYFIQLSVYLFLARQDPRWESTELSAELLFIDITSGFIQRVALDAISQTLLNRQVEGLHAFLNHRWEAHRKLTTLSVQSPFPKLRPGQKRTRDQLCDLWEESRLLLFEAPTGFGKTGMILELSLKGLSRQLYDRIVVLTGKSTGQLQIVRQLEGMLAGRGKLNYLQLRNRAEHRITSSRHTCGDGLDCRTDVAGRWETSTISPPSFFENGPVTLDRIKDLGQETGVCPYEISRSLLPFADLLIADYNYLFGPRNQSLFFQIPGFEPAATLLVIDEAHNLPTRVCDALSHSLSREEVEQTENELQFARADPRLLRIYSELGRFLASLKEPEAPDLSSEYELAGLVENIAETLQSCPPSLDLLTGNVRDELWRHFEILEFLKNESLERLIWSPGQGRLNLTCLSAPSRISATLEQFSKVILMSATLSPTGYFAGLCGINPGECSHLVADAPWREHSYEIATDLRVDTRYRSREAGYATTSAAASAMCQDASTPVVLFFSSYQYAASIFERIRLDYPQLRIALQPRKGDLSDREKFLEESLAVADLLLLVLGSSFSEGIDLLGGRVSRAIVVGPALPEVNAAQNYRMHSLSHLPRNEAFRQVYQIPALIKINQALGRLVRAPGQRVKVLLHCSRFNQDSYRSLLDSAYQSPLTISSEEDLKKWVNS